MTNEEIIKEFNELPLEARKEIEDFVVFLRERHKKSNKIEKDFSKEKFVGMWKDRKDMKDGAEWARELRQKEWTK